jgi:hypothetical protein
VIGSSSLKSSLPIDIIGELVFESSPGSPVRNSTIGEGDELGNSSVSSWFNFTNCRSDMLGNRCRVRSDSGEVLKSTVGRAFLDATGVTAVIEESCVFTP